MPSSNTGQLYLQQGDEKEEGVSSSSKLRVQEPRQESENVVLGCAEESKEKVANQIQAERRITFAKYIF